MQDSAKTRVRRLPAITMAAALMGATALGSLTPGWIAPANAAAAVIQHDYADLVAKVAPAVVLIEVTKKAELQPAGGQSLPQGTPFDHFFERFGMPGMPGMPGGQDSPFGQPREMSGVGTGFVIKSDGQIVTNAHVVDGADTVTVTLADGRKVDAKVIGSDPATDIALIQAEAKDLPTVSFGSSDALRVGEGVVAIGSPFGLGNTVTSGIVSALGRDIHSGPFDNYIQTDAAINKGNSGGPLFNASGEVVGINTAIFSPTGGSVGIGFAVPADTAMRVVADLAGDGKVERGWLGVHIQPVSDDIAAALGLDKASGVLITEVTGDTPAAKAGLSRGDIVTSVDGKTVAEPRDLTRLIATATPGSEVTLGLLRSGKPVDAKVTLGERPADPA
ncbi:Do family serine endopeptidase [Seohaeicola zhoushanensis]|uniref:Probable periplasmic serine endoprotease DegP-like n=1 Tax=Seohaeicola zhoushanensis TaxID=1569283 RepID=A0A8J3M8E6_9RHOB|nr:Do family serine endopeptidase [Seohaeicola zhoushanensis]GHF53959.1 serine protease [Seohaeicola zhoushanensis]